MSRKVDLDHVRNLKSAAAALEYACSLAGLTPKEIYPFLPNKDKSAWSRICSGQRDPQAREITRINRVLGNSAYLLYLCHVDGWDIASMHRVQDDKDRRIAELEEAVTIRDRAIGLILEAQRRKSP